MTCNGRTGVEYVVFTTQNDFYLIKKNLYIIVSLEYSGFIFGTALFESFVKLGGHSAANTTP